MRTLALLLALPTTALANEPLDGETFSNIASTTTNVMRVHLDFLDAQSDYNLAAPYVLADGKMAKTSLVLGDGQAFDGGVAHWLGGAGLGYGNPRDSLAVFGGIQFDALRAGTYPYGGKAGTFHAARMDTLGYVGVGIFGWQASYGWRRVSRTTGLDTDGEFIAEPDLPFREGAPDVIQNPRKNDVELRSQMVTVYYRQGYSLGALFADILPEGSYTAEEARKQVLAALRAKIEPKQLVGDAGSYGFGFDRYAEGVDYYDESDTTESSYDPDAVVWELPLRGRDLGGSGIGLRVVPQVKPQILLRSAEASFRFDVGSGVVGGRFLLTDRAGGWEASYDVYAQLVGVKFYDYGEKGFTAGTLGLSWSWNSPDATTFLPYSKMHVLGLQLSIGVPGMHPIVPSAAGWRSSAFDEVDPYYEMYDPRGEEAPLELPPTFPPEHPPNLQPLPSGPDSGLGDSGATDEPVPGETPAEPPSTEGDKQE